MQKVITVENMRKSDAYTIKNLASGKQLMRKAALGIFNAVVWKGKIAIVTGGGNNGGDGFALACILFDNGYSCKIFKVSQKLTEDSFYYYEKCQQSGIDIVDFNAETELKEFDIVVDCIFGTGFKAQPKGIARQAIEKINTTKYVVSADINSGLNGDNGRAEVAVKSDLTVSIGYYKTGHFLNDASDYIKSLTNADIGIKLIEKPFYLMQKEDFKSIFIKRKNNTHKGTYGKTVLIGGSIMYSGAIKLAAMSKAALCSGNGLTTLAVPESIVEGVLPYILESAIFPLPDSGGNMLFNKKAIDEALIGAKSIAIGMGWGQGQDNAKILEYILNNYDVPTVIDADGINTLAGMDLRIIEGKKTILTPHIKEFSRLAAMPTNEIIDNPIFYAKQFAEKHNTILLLKGTTTIITDGKKVFLTNTGTPGMAKGGSGDVLCGIISAINAFSKQSLLLNTAAAAFINGKAAEYVVKEKNEYSLVASDTVNNIYKAINLIIEE